MNHQELNVRPIIVADLRLFCDWYSARIRMRLPEEWAPQTGLAVCDQAGTVLALALLYLEKSSPVAVFGWCVADPSLPPLQAGRAVRTALRAMPEYARSKGAVHLVGIFGSPGLNRELGRMGFVDGDRIQEKYKRL